MFEWIRIQLGLNVDGLINKMIRDFNSDFEAYRRDFIIDRKELAGATLLGPDRQHQA